MARPQLIIYHFVKDKERNVLVHEWYEAMSKEFYDFAEYSLSTPIEEIAKKAFKNPLMRWRLSHWRGYGNSNEIYIAYDEDDLKEVEWFEKDMQYLNGAHTTSNFSFLDKELVRQEVKDSYRNNHGYGHFDDLH